MNEIQKNNEPFFQIHLLYGILENYKIQMNHLDEEMKQCQLKVIDKKWCNFGLDCNNNQLFIDIYLLQNRILKHKERIDISLSALENYKLETLGKEWIV